MEEKKTTFKSLCQKKDKIFKLKNLSEEIVIDSITKEKIYFFSVSDQKKAKRGSFQTGFFIENIKSMRDASEKKEVKKPKPLITLDMITKGFRFRRDVNLPENEVTKINKTSVTIAYVKDLKDPTKKKETGIYESFEPAEFLSIVNKANEKVSKKLKQPLKANKQAKKEVELSVKKTTDKLTVELAPAARNKYAFEVSEIQKEINDREAEKKAFTSQIGGEIKELEAKRDVLSDKVLTGKEWQDVAVQIEYHWKKNEKLRRRMDTGEVIKRTAIPKEELQQSLFKDAESS